MMTFGGANKFARTFQDIPDDKISESDQTGFLAGLAWRNGSDWLDLLKSKRILVISEAGAGKTYECQEQARVLWEAGEPAFYLELAVLDRTNLIDMLTPEQELRFSAWRDSQSDIATFFLDSIDELELSLGSFRQALSRLSKAVAGQLRRVRVVITSRPNPIDARLVREILPVPPKADDSPTSEEFADIAMNRQASKKSDERQVKDWRNVALMPLSNDQIKQIATLKGVVDPDALLSDIRRRNAEGFCRRPQDLIELCADWNSHHRIRSHYDQVNTDISVKLKARTDRREKAELSPDKAREGAARLALAAVLTRKLTLRHSAEADEMEDSSVVPLKPEAVLPDWSQQERATLLERSLFGFASYGRVRFHHRSVIEFLAAERLHALLGRGLPIKTLKRILFATTAQGEVVVKPSLLPIAGWLALHEPAIFAEILRRDPSVLFNHGDPETLTVEQRSRALGEYVERYGRGGWRGLQVPYIQIHRFADKALAASVKRLWAKNIENPEVRMLLLDLIGAGKMSGCADIAYDVATKIDAAYGERTDALDALIALDDPRLAAISASLSDSALWPNKLARTAILRLFPKHITVELLCSALSRITEGKNLSGDISWRLPRIIAEAGPSSFDVDGLRRGLTQLVTGSVASNENSWPPITSQREFLIPALAATCSRQLRDGDPSADVMRSCVIALRLAERSNSDDRPTETLRKTLGTLPPTARRMAFVAEDTFLEARSPQSDGHKRYMRLVVHGALHLNFKMDAAWVNEMLADRARPAAERAMMLEAGIRLRDPDVEWGTHLATLKSHVSDLPELTALLDEKARPVKPDPELERMERDHEKRMAKHRRREERAHESWVEFWREVAEHPDTAFAADRSEMTAWNLWQAMDRSGSNSRAAGWNRRFIERHFGKEVADRLRLVIMAYWRKDRPTLRSEREEDKKNTYLTRWQFGLAGIAAEAENPGWVANISEDEAKLALRYAPLEINGFPTWLESIATAYPASIDAVLGRELSYELGEAIGEHSIFLQTIRHATPTVARYFLARLLDWLKKADWRTGGNQDQDKLAARLRQVIQILIQHGDQETISQVQALASAELSSEITQTMTNVWLPNLLRLAPAQGIDALARILQDHEPSKFGPTVELLARLFAGRDDYSSVDLSRFDPELLLRLARLAYQHIRPSDDMYREENSYTPNERDRAETARGNILHALLTSKGAAGWEIKIKLADDPLFADLKDRTLAMARERAALDEDTNSYREADIVALEKHNELPPVTRNEMFSLMVDRLDDLKDLLLRDDSPRAAWALINDEPIMRQQIALLLRLEHRGAYKVNQEAVTAEGKETDIRLQSVSSEQEAVIELKIGDKERSANDLKSALMNQLVTKYMAPEIRRSGCLLITIAGQRSWQHPIDRSPLDFSGLIAFLNVEAARIEKDMADQLRLIVVGLDLTPRLPIENKARN